MKEKAAPEARKQAKKNVKKKINRYTGVLKTPGLLV